MYALSHLSDPSDGAIKGRKITLALPALRKAYKKERDDYVRKEMAREIDRIGGDE